MYHKISVTLLGFGLFLLLQSMIKVQAQNTERTKIYVGLCSNPVEPSQNVFMAFNSQVTIATQSAVPGAIFSQLKGCAVTGVRFAFGLDMDGDATALVKFAKSNHLTGLAFGRKKAVKGWNEINFSAPVLSEKLTDKMYYFGYEFFNSDPKKEPVILDPKYSDPDGLWLSIGSSEWMSGTQLSYNTLMAQLVIEGPKDLLSNVAFLNAVQLSRTINLAEKITVPLAISNPGSEPIKTLEVVAYIGENKSGAQPISITLKDAIPPRSAERVIVPIEIAIDKSQITVGAETSIGLSLAKVNGKSNSLAYNHSTKVIFLTGEPIARAALLEQFSTEQCTGCPIGEMKVATAIKRWKGVPPVWIIHHVGYGTDFLSLKEDNNLMRFYIPSAFCPGILLDRNPDNRALVSTSGKRGIGSITTVEGVMSAIGEAAAEPGYATLTMENGRATSGNFAVKVSGRISKELVSSDAKPYITVLVAQSNIKAQQQAGVAEGVDFRHMAAPRFYVSSGDGDLLDVKPDGTYVYTKEVAIPAEVPKHYPLIAPDCKVVAFLHYQNTNGANGNYVLNSAEVPYSEFPLSVSSPSEDGQYAVYSEDGQISVVGGRPYTKVSVYDLTGRLVPMKGLAPGVYVVVVDAPAHRESHKVILD